MLTPREIYDAVNTDPSPPPEADNECEDEDIYELASIAEETAGHYATLKQAGLPELLVNNLTEAFQRHLVATEASWTAADIAKSMIDHAEGCDDEDE